MWFSMTLWRCQWVRYGPPHLAFVNGWAATSVAQWLIQPRANACCFGTRLGSSRCLAFSLVPPFLMSTSALRAFAYSCRANW